MEQLKIAWQYRFWIVLGLASVLTLVFGWIGSSGLAKEAEEKQTALSNEITDLQKRASGTNPNDTWTNKVGELETGLRKDVDGAWEVLYERQAALMTWPDDFKAKFEGPEAKNELLDRNRFKAAFQKQFVELRASLKPVSIQGEAGNIALASGQVEKFFPAWVGAAQPPSVPQIQFAQQQVWLLRALFDVINSVNDTGDGWRDKPIKRMLQIELGGPAINGDMSSTQEMKPHESQAGAATKKGSGGWYYPSPDEELFKLIPVYLHLNVDQREVNNILAEFSSCKMPFRISKVTLAAASEPAGTATGKKKRKTGQAGTGSTRIGPPPAKEDEFFHMTDLKIWGQLYFFQMPPSVKAAAETKPEGP